MTGYVVQMSNGSLLHGGREYATRQAARRAAERSERKTGLYPVEIRIATERQPNANDAQGWDDYRIRHGISGSHS